MIEIQDTLRKIQAIKLDLLSQAYNGLLSCREEAKNGFLKAVGENDFTEFFSKTKAAINDHMAIQLISWPLSQPFHVAVLQTAKEAMSRVDYQPPIDRNEKMIHLKALWYFFNEDITYPHSIEETCLDLSFAKLLSAVNKEIDSEIIRAQRELPRTKKTAESTRKRAEIWKDFVLEIYKHGDSIDAGTRFSEVCRIIIDQFEESRGNKDAKWGQIPKGMKTPSFDSVKKILMEKAIISKDFEKRGRYWFKKM